MQYSVSCVTVISSVWTGTVVLREHARTYRGFSGHGDGIEEGAAGGGGGGGFGGAGVDFDLHIRY